MEVNKIKNCNSLDTNVELKVKFYDRFHQLCKHLDPESDKSNIAFEAYQFKGLIPEHMIEYLTSTYNKYYIAKKTDKVVTRISYAESIEIRKYLKFYMAEMSGASSHSDFYILIEAKHLPILTKIIRLSLGIDIVFRLENTAKYLTYK